MNSYIHMFTITQNGDNNDSPVEEDITRPRRLAPDTVLSTRTPNKRWCSKRHRVVRTSELRITEGDYTDPRTLRFEDADLILVADVQRPTPSLDVLYLESLIRTQALLDQMTPQKVKYQRSKKRRR